MAGQLDVSAMVAEDYLSQTLEQTRLLLLDRSSQWLQLPPERRAYGADPVAGRLARHAHVRSVSLTQ